PRRRLRALVRLLLCERALNRRSFGGDLLDVAIVHLLQEERGVGHADPGLRLRRARAGVVVDREQPDDESDPPPADPESRPLLRGLGRRPGWLSQPRRTMPPLRVGAHLSTMPRMRRLGKDGLDIGSRTRLMLAP